LHRERLAQFRPFVGEWNREKGGRQIILEDRVFLRKGCLVERQQRALVRGDRVRDLRAADARERLQHESEIEIDLGAFGCLARDAQDARGVLVAIARALEIAEPFTWDRLQRRAHARSYPGDRHVIVGRAERDRPFVEGHRALELLRIFGSLLEPHRDLDQHVGALVRRDRFGIRRRDRRGDELLDARARHVSPPPGRRPARRAPRCRRATPPGTVA